MKTINQTHPDFKITNHHELRRDVSIDCSEPILTDQSFKNSCDINVIMASYAKTGMLPQSTTQEPRYIDNTTIPNLEQAFSIVNTATEMFFDLPPTIRKLMDNDPSKLESFVMDPKNKNLLIQEGIISAPAPIVESLQPTQPQPITKL